MKTTLLLLTRAVFATALLAFLALPTALRAETVAQLWAKTFNGPHGDNDNAYAIAGDASGNVVIAGHILISSGFNTEDAYVAKYASATGALLWSKIYNAPVNSTDQFNSVAVDANGDVIVVGTSHGGGTGLDAYIAKYASANGALIWEQRYNASGGNSDYGSSVALDASGNVIIGGFSPTVSGSNLFAAKYRASDGVLLWAQTHEGNGSYVAVDPSGNVAIVGTTGGGDIYTGKYASLDGAVLWEKIYDGPVNSTDFGVAVAVDNAGNVATLGASVGTTTGFGSDSDYYTAKYDATDGHLLWEQRTGGDGNTQDFPKSVAVDAVGNVVVTGYITPNEVTFTYDILTVKYAAANGAVVWTKQYNDPANNNDMGSAVKVDAAGNAVITGSTFGPGGGVDIYTAKYAAADGAVVWQQLYNGVGLSDGANALTLFPDGSVAVTGSTQFFSSYDIVTVKYAILDTTSPNTTLTATPPVLDNHNTASFSFEGTDDITPPGSLTFEFSLDGSPYASTSSPLVLNSLPEGAHTFTVRAVDAVNNKDPSPAEFTWIVDTTPPETEIVSGPSGTVNSSEATFQLSSSEPGVTFHGSLDGAPETEVTSPAIFPGLSQGPHTFTVYAVDAAGSPDPTPATADWVVQLDPIHEALYAKGGPVPGAGSDPYIPAGATWYGFGIPAIDEDGTVAVLAKWKNPAGSAMGTYGSGLFVDGVLRVAVGAPVAGVAGATYKKLRDPVIAGGEVATIATFAGVAATEDTAVIGIDSTGLVTLLAREGDVAIGVDSGTFKAFKSVSAARGFYEVGHAGILYTALLNPGTGTPAVGTANDFGAWLSFDGATTLAVREGDTAPGLDPGETVKSFKLLKTVSGSPGQARGHTGQQSGSFSAVTSTGRQRLLSFNLPTGSLLASSGDVLGGTTLPLAQWKTFGPLSESTVAFALRGVLQSNVGGVTGPAATGIFLGDSTGTSWEPVVQLGDATGIPDVTFKALKDPVLAADCESLAFPATLIGTGVTPTSDTSLWWKPDSGTLTLLAREGDPALGGGTWKSFASLAIPGGVTGPIFLASLSSVPTTQDVGVWAVDSAGALRVLFREGDIVAGKTLKGIAVLKAVSGSPGTTHAFNSNAHVVWRAAFTDGTAAVVVTTVP